MTTVTGPATPSAGPDWATLKGSLLFFDVGTLEVGITTPFGVSDAIRCDLTVLDGPNAGQVHENTRVFSGLKRQLTPHSKIVGRLGQGQARAGQNPPWTLINPTPDELTRAQAWDQRRNAATNPAPVSESPLQAVPTRDDIPF